MVTKKEETKLKGDIEDVTEQLNKLAKGLDKAKTTEPVQPAPEPVQAPAIVVPQHAPAPVETVNVNDILKNNLKNNRGNVMIAFLEDDEVSVVHLKKDNLNNADFIKRLMGG